MAGVGWKPAQRDPCKNNPYSGSPGQQRPGRSYRFRPYPPNLWTLPSRRARRWACGDDLALNAQQVAEVRADRELPMVWAVAKGSALNKAVLVPMALAISAFAPWLVTPLLMLGGAYLCFEGVEKLAHPWLYEAAPGPHAPPPSEDERAKVRAAIRTDFVLSAEIIVITLGTVAGLPLATQIGVMIGIATLMTVGVYGLVAGIVRDQAIARQRDAGGNRAGWPPRSPALPATPDQHPQPVPVSPPDPRIGIAHSEIVARYVT
jgi:hypothetical protein